MSTDLQHIRDWMARVPGPRSPHGVIGLAFAHLETLLAEVAEHRAARGIEAPAPWRRSGEALWERAASERRVVDEDGEVCPDDCPDGHLFVWDQSPGPWLWRWYSYRNEQWAMGEAATCTGALAAADAALAGGGT